MHTSHLADRALASGSLDDLEVLADAVLSEGDPLGEGLAAVAACMRRNDLKPATPDELAAQAAVWERGGCPRPDTWCTGAINVCKCPSCKALRA